MLTDEQYFQGHLDYLPPCEPRPRSGAAQDLCSTRTRWSKPEQPGPDACYLIAECLDDCHLRALFNRIVELGMTPLVELYEPENLSRVFDAGATLIGINNRDLRTSRSTWTIPFACASGLPDECVVVGESGIRTRADVLRLQDAGVDAILVGESLMRKVNIGTAVDELLGR